MMLRRSRKLGMVLFSMQCSLDRLIVQPCRCQTYQWLLRCVNPPKEWMLYTEVGHRRVLRVGSREKPKPLVERDTPSWKPQTKS